MPGGAVAVRKTVGPNRYWEDEEEEGMRQSIGTGLAALALVVTLGCSCAQAGPVWAYPPTERLVHVSPTGTPEGVGPIEPGDSLEARIEKVGCLEVSVVAD